MNKTLKVILCYVISVTFLFTNVLTVKAVPSVEAPSYILMEASTGKVICE